MHNRSSTRLLYDLRDTVADEFTPYKAILSFVPRSYLYVYSFGGMATGRWTPLITQETQELGKAGDLIFKGLLVDDLIDCFIILPNCYLQNNAVLDLSEFKDHVFLLTSRTPT